MRTKTAIIVGGTMAAAGILICCFVFFFAGFDFSKIATVETYSEKTSTFSSESVRQINLELDGSRVGLLQTEQQDISLTYNTGKDMDYAITETDGILRISTKCAPEWFVSFTDGFLSGIIDFQHRKVVLRIPEGYEGNIDIKTQNGSVKLDSLSLTGNISLTTSNASVRGNRISSKTLAIQNNNGSIHLSQVRTASLHSVTVNARITLESVTAEKEAIVENNNGSIRLAHLDCPDILLSTKNASIKGTVCGNKEDFQISADVKNGASNLLSTFNSAAQKQLVASAANGSVQINFTNET